MHCTSGLPQWLPKHCPATETVLAWIVYEFPVVSKLPLSEIPQFGAIIFACPPASMPMIAEVGGPNVYRQLVLVPPYTLVATARAVTGWLLSPKICIKYVG